MVIFTTTRLRTTRTPNVVNRYVVIIPDKAISPGKAKNIDQTVNIKKPRILTTFFCRFLRFSGLSLSKFAGYHKNKLLNIGITKQLA